MWDFRCVQGDDARAGGRFQSALRPMPTMRDATRHDLRTPTGRSDALDISHADRPRWRPLREGHVAADVAIVLRPVHAEPARGDRSIRERVSGRGSCSDNGEKGGSEHRAHVRTRYGSPELCKVSKVTMS